MSEAKPAKPPLGQEQIGRICNRFTDLDEHGNDIICGKPARFHLIWDVETMENSYSCLDHAREATERWCADFYHRMGPCCGMPGVSFFPEENVCRYDEGGVPVVEEAREEVGAKPA